MPDVILLALGNTACSDDGFGPRLLDALRQQYHLPGNLLCLNGGTAPLGHYQRLGRCHNLILLDAVKLPVAQSATRLVVQDPLRIDATTSQPISTHDVRAESLLQLMATLGSLPERVALLGASVSSCHQGDTLSPELQAILPEACSVLVRMLQQRGIRLSRRLKFPVDFSQIDAKS